MATSTRSLWLAEAASLVERRLLQTSGVARIPPDKRDDYQRGIMRALEEVIELLREEAQKHA
jgi:hypothetical protein